MALSALFSCCEVCEVKLLLIVLTDNGACGSGSYLIYWVERNACPHACCERLPEQRADSPYR